MEPRCGNLIEYEFAYIDDPLYKVPVLLRIGTRGFSALTIPDPHYDEEYTIYVEIRDEHSDTNIDLITAYEPPLIVIFPELRLPSRQKIFITDIPILFKPKAETHIDTMPFVI